VGAPRCPQCAADEPITEQSASPLASLSVACLPGDGCRYQGVVRRVMLPQIVPGVIDMPHLVCAGCGAEMTHVEEGQHMPKITVHGGPSIDGAELEGGEEPSTQEVPGTDSSTSSEKPQTSPQTNEPEDPSPARKTGSRSSKPRTGGSTARSTGGGPTAPKSDDE
jgi:hypothetical protein